jgi:hypothetical protein
MSINPPDTNERALSKIRACLMAVLFPSEGIFIISTKECRSNVCQLEEARAPDDGRMIQGRVQFVLDAGSRLFPNECRQQLELPVDQKTPLFAKEMDDDE